MIEQDLQVGDIGVEAWDGTRMRIAYMRFDNRSDMLALDWDAIADTIGIQYASVVERMIVNEYRGPIGSGGVLASGGWRVLATWLRPGTGPLAFVPMVWNSTEDWKRTKNYERDIKLLHPWQ